MKTFISQTSVRYLAILVALVAVAALLDALLVANKETGLGVVRPVEAQSADRMAEMNLLAFRTSSFVFEDRLHNYLASAEYSWMDWSNDNCSAPWLPLVKLVTYVDEEDLFRPGCDRHDWAWRTLAVLDDGSGLVWNQRNRLAADERFPDGHLVRCDTEYGDPLIESSDEYFQCQIEANFFYRGVRSVMWPPDEDISSWQIIVGSQQVPTDQDHVNSVTANQEFVSDSDFKDDALRVDYMEMNGKPLVHLYIGDFPVDKPVRVEWIRANTMALNKRNPTERSWDHKYFTDTSYVETHGPVRAYATASEDCTQPGGSFLADSGDTSSTKSNW